MSDFRPTVGVAIACIEATRLTPTARLPALAEWLLQPSAQPQA
ncbi:MAG: hypothetical protein ABR580_11405 [Halomonas sp.]